MKGALKSRRFWVILVLALALWYPTAYPRGAAMAYIDAVRGHREVKVYGYPAPWDGEYSQLLKEKFGVTFRPVAGCVVSPFLIWYVHGYNSVSTKWVIDKVWQRRLPGVREPCEGAVAG
jgi:hypothetical protein